MSTFHFQQFSIVQDHAAMKVGTDSDLLGALGAGGDDILDIGTGTGVLSLMMAQRFPSASITAIEIDDNAVIDASTNFAASPFHDRITLHHTSFQKFLSEHEQSGTNELYDSIICNPPYFDKSLECPDLGRNRARHSSNLPFDVLIQGAYTLLKDGGVFSVCIPPEVFTIFDKECHFAGFTLRDNHAIKSVPEKGVKRHILIYKKGVATTPNKHIACMRDADRSVSQWYKTLMKDFLTHV